MSLLDTASLIVTPNGYKEGKLYSVIPSDGSGDMSVTRATTATRVNSAGLVELVPYNLAQYSEQFDNAIWLKDAVTISANATTAPNGTLTADLIYPQSSGNFKYIYQGYTQGNNVYTSSVYVKAQNKSKIWMYIESVGGYGICYFDLINGTIQATTLIGSIESVGNGWYRCSVTTASSLSLVSGTGFGVCDALGSTYVAANGTDGVYIWGAQLVEGSVAKDYQKTETRLNIPRLDYSNGTCPSLLVEPQRSNVTLQSENLSTTWYTAGGLLTTNATTSPSGILNADKIKADTSNGIHVYQQTLAVSASTVYTMSVFVKSSELTFLELADASSLKGQTFNLTAQTILAPQTGGFSPTTSSKIEDYGNGWLKCSITYTTLSIVSFFRISLSNGSTTSFTGNNTDGLFVWGAQLEAGSYPTSYIPTTSASVTRNADVISKTGISSLIGQTEGTIFLDYIWNNNASDVIPIGVNGNNGKFIWFRLNGIQFYGNGSSLVFDAYFGSQVYGQRYKLAFVYGQNDFRLYMNGSLIASQTSGTFSGTFDDIVFTPIGSAPYNDSTKHNAVALWKTRLTNAQLATLTTI